MQAVHKEYKSKLFCFIFGSEAHREWTLSLYNAVSGRRFTDPGQITAATVRQVLFLGAENDAAFLISDEVNLYEHQSTVNLNMPLRMLQYLSNVYEQLVKLRKKNKYGTSLIRLPVPKFVVFYNGMAEQPEERVLYLHDAFPPRARREEADAWVRVHMVNINKGKNEGLMDACPPLREYSWLVDRIREHVKEGRLEEAVDRALDEMPGSYEIKPWLEANHMGVKKMVLTEYSEELTMELFKEEGRELGLEEGRAEGRNQARIESIRNIMDSFKVSAQQAMDALKIPASEQPKLMSML